LNMHTVGIHPAFCLFSNVFYTTCCQHSQFFANHDTMDTYGPLGDSEDGFCPKCPEESPQSGSFYSRNRPWSSGEPDMRHASFPFSDGM